MRAAHAGKTLVFTNGCFDLLHVGHVRYLQAARRQGDVLVVGLNGDGSVRQLKGPKRPLNPEAARAEVLAALSAVDHVVIFDEPRVTSLLAEVRPDIYVKGGDYTLETLNREEVAVVQRLGARVELIPMVPGVSTTGILQKMSGG
ncbi:MAG: D-glycero-beta-D-manno-heptose 1-phosphate adenylyltransferase [Verrucomicrobia bacterium]|nr:D-glycero-beta-D-manno-heptose 1-phosphate adenylyltransferase [Verrucomicrobiota bacterium]